MILFCIVEGRPALREPFPRLLFAGVAEGLSEARDAFEWWQENPASHRHGWLRMVETEELDWLRRQLLGVWQPVLRVLAVFEDDTLAGVEAQEVLQKKIRRAAERWVLPPSDLPVRLAERAAAEQQAQREREERRRRADEERAAQQHEAQQKRDAAEAHRRALIELKAASRADRDRRLIAMQAARDAERTALRAAMRAKSPTSIRELQRAKHSARPTIAELKKRRRQVSNPAPVETVGGLKILPPLVKGMTRFTTSRLAVLPRPEGGGIPIPVLGLLAWGKFGLSPEALSRQRLFAFWCDGNSANETPDNVELAAREA